MTLQGRLISDGHGVNLNVWQFAEGFVSYPNAFVAVVDKIGSLDLFRGWDIFANVHFSAADIINRMGPSPTPLAIVTFPKCLSVSASP